jgi:ribosomal protein S12 methylthiotransferase accessory factor
MTMQSLGLQRLFEVVDHLVDERVGVIQQVTELDRQFGMLNVFCFYAIACNTKAFACQRNPPYGGGASSDRRLAVAKAIGEAIERYCAAIYDPEELPLCSYESASFPCVSPSVFALYNAKQYSSIGFPYLPFDRFSPVRWRSATNLQTGKLCYLPAAIVYLPYSYGDEEVPIVQQISTGLACHCSFSEAAVSAICEVIERDAVTITWQARLPRRPIVLQTLTERNRDLVSRFKQAKGQVSLFDITMDHGVPTILAVLRSQVHNTPALIMAAAAHLDPDRAVTKSLEELALSFRWGQCLQRNNLCMTAVEDFSSVVSQEDHFWLFNENNVRYADFIFASEDWIDFQTIANLSTGQPHSDLQVLNQKIGRIGHDILLADVTTPDIGDLGLYVVRAVIPGFHPLFFGYQLRALGGRRLWEVPQKLGYLGITLESGDNPIPHPFP